MVLRSLWQQYKRVLCHRKTLQQQHKGWKRHLWRTCTHTHWCVVSLQHATMQGRCKESIVMPTDYNVGPEENVTQMMTHKSWGRVTQPRPRDRVFSMERQHTKWCLASGRHLAPDSIASEGALSQIYGWFRAWGQHLVLALNVPLCSGLCSQAI